MNAISDQVAEINSKIMGIYIYLEPKDLTLLSMLLSGFLDSKENQERITKDFGDISEDDLPNLVQRADEIRMGLRREGQVKKIPTY